MAIKSFTKILTIMSDEKVIYNTAKIKLQNQWVSITFVKLIINAFYIINKLAKKTIN